MSNSYNIAKSIFCLRRFKRFKCFKWYKQTRNVFKRETGLFMCFLRLRSMTVSFDISVNIWFKNCVRYTAFMCVNKRLVNAL